MANLLKWLTTISQRPAGRWPTTATEWIDGARDVDRRLREASIEVAEEIGEQDLASEIRANTDDFFPAAEYLFELNKRSNGAGDRAYHLAVRRRPRR